MPKIEIEVDQVLVSAVSLEVDPGDKLLVMNGMVIGLVERRAPTVDIPAITHQAANGTTLKQPTKPTQAPKGKSSPSKSPSHRKPRELLPHVITTLRTKGPLTARSIATDVSKGLGVERVSVKAALTLLRQQGTVKALSETERFPRYTLNEPQHNNHHADHPPA